MELNTLIYKNFVWRGFFYFTSLVLNIAMARILGAELSGQLYFFLNNIYIVLLIGSFSLDSGITYFISKGELPENKLASFSFTWAILVSVIISILFLFLYSNNQVLFENNIFLPASIWFTLGTILHIYFSAFFYSHDNYKTPNLVSGIINLLLLICIPWQQNWLGFIDGKMFLIIFFAATLLQGIIVSVSWFIRGRFILSFKLFPLKEISPVIKYSLAALTGNLIYFILYRIDYWFVEYYCSPKSLGNYIQVSRLGQLLILPCTIIAATLFPQSSRQHVSFESASFTRLFRIVVLVYLLAGIFTLAFGKSLILFLWGKDYNEMFEPLLITMPGIIFLAVSYLFSPIFSGKGKVSYNVIICLLTLVAVVVCNLLFVPVLGIMGAAISTTVGFTVMMILYFVFAKLKYGFSVLQLFRN
jgi:O-antigen/teichoic acid export membrane protein